MNYRNYVFGIIFLCCIPFLFIWILAWVLPEEYYMDIEYPYWIQQKDYIFSDNVQQEILLLGDSKVKTGIISTEMGDNVYNLALGGATSIEMYYTLKTYLQHHPKPLLVIIAFAPVHYFEVGSYWKRNLYFRYFSEETANEVDDVMLNYDGTLKQSEKYFHRLPNVYMKPIIRHLFNPRTEENRETYKKISDAKGWLCLNVDGREPVFNNNMSLDDFKILPSLNYYMNLLLTLCKSESIPVYIEQSPMRKEEYDILNSSGYFDSYNAYIHSFALKYEIPVEELVPTFEDRYFSDDLHLNEEGARLLTAQWKEKYKIWIDKQ